MPIPELTVIDVGGPGPEDVILEPDGAIVTGTADGLVRRVRPGTGEVQVLADTGGRPLGLERLPDGRLLVADADRGLLRVDPADGGVEVLVAAIGDSPMIFTSNVAVGPDGSIWFSESSQRHDLPNYRAEIFEHSGTGRLNRLAPDGTVTTVLHGLEFANGVAVAADGSAVYVAETAAYRVRRVRWDGERATAVDVLVDNLPGFPDNLGLGADGLLWVAVASPRDRIVDLLAPAPPWLRSLVWKVPEALQPKEKHYAWVIAVDPADGSIVHDLQGKHPRFGMTTGVCVEPDGGRIWLGSLMGTTVAGLCVP